MNLSEFLLKAIFGNIEINKWLRYLIVDYTGLILWQNVPQ